MPHCPACKTNVSAALKRAKRAMDSRGKHDSFSFVCPACGQFFQVPVAAGATLRLTKAGGLATRKLPRRPCQLPRGGGGRGAAEDAPQEEALNQRRGYNHRRRRRRRGRLLSSIPSSHHGYRHSGSRRLESGMTTTFPTLGSSLSFASGQAASAKAMTQSSCMPEGAPVLTAPDSSDRELESLELVDALGPEIRARKSDPPLLEHQGEVVDQRGFRLLGEGIALGVDPAFLRLS